MVSPQYNNYKIIYLFIYFVVSKTIYTSGVFHVLPGIYGSLIILTLPYISRAYKTSEVKNMDEQKNLKPIDLGGKMGGEIELPTIDVKQYVGKKVKIEKADTYEGHYGYFVKVETVVIDTVEGGKEPIHIRASRIFGLQENSDGVIGWGKDTNLGIFLAKMGCKSYKDLVGKEVVCQTITNKNDKKDYLSFN